MRMISQDVVGIARRPRTYPVVEHAYQATDGNQPEIDDAVTEEEVEDGRTVFVRGDLDDFVCGEADDNRVDYEDAYP